MLSKLVRGIFIIKRRVPCRGSNQVRMSADEYAFEAEEKSTIAEIKDLISKSNALKHAASEKQNLLDSFVKKRRLLIEKNDEL